MESEDVLLGSRSPADSHSLRRALDIAGIQFRVAPRDEAPDGVASHGLGGSMTLVDFFVANRDLTNAKEIEQSDLAARLPDTSSAPEYPEGSCPACGTLLERAPSECPDCGLALG